MKDNNSIRDVFLSHQEHYKNITGDYYSASQMAAIATEADFGITKDQLINILNS